MRNYINNGPKTYEKTVIYISIVWILLIFMVLQFCSAILNAESENWGVSMADTVF